MIEKRTTAGDPFIPEARWSYADVAYVFLVGQAAAILGGGIALAMDAGDLVLLSVGLVAQTAGSLALIAHMSRTRATGDWSRDFGLEIRPGHLWGLAAGMLLQLAVALIVGPLIELLAPEDPPQQGVADIAEQIDGTTQALVFLFLVVILAPLIEEMIFRGMLLSRLRRSFGPWPAILLSAAAFASIHLIDPDAIFAVPGLFLVGVALGWFALRHGNLSLPIFVHAGVNLTGAIFLIYGEEIVEGVENVEGVLRLL